jgi:predicted unusual protein kinase regulating ubiquinone biosynthesis (AarF/ABC1/UbiB family)
VREDFRNLFFFLLPGRLSSDWENTREQFEDLRTRIEREADYLREAASLQRAASLFTEADGIVVPRVFPDYSTSRVLTMQRLEGLHLNQFLATNPSQELRNEFARKIVRAWYRMLYAGRVIYVDYNPGNFIFMPDGRLGLIDFGCMLELDERLWEMFHKMDRPITTGDRDGRIAFIKKWSSISDSPADAERLRLMDEYLELSWQPRSCNCEFDFSDEPRMRRGMHLFADMVKKRYTRGHATSPIVMRQQLGLGAMLYRMKAKIDIAPIAEEEVTAAGWDRSDYAPR